MTKRCKFLIIENAILMVLFILCAIQNCCAENEFAIITVSSAIIFAFWFFSIFQFVFAWKDALWRKIANIVAVIGKIFFCVSLFPLVTWIFHESHWTAEQWAQIGNFGSDIWSFMLNAGAGSITELLLIADIVIVGVDVVWMVKKLMKHNQAKMKKA